MNRWTLLPRFVPALVILAGACWCAGDAGAQDKPANPAPPAQPAPETPPEEKPSAGTAAEAATDYVQRMKSDNPVGAVRTYWDIDAMLADIFGDHLKRNSDEERAEMKRLLLTFVENVYSHPNIAAAMKQATFSDFKEGDGPAEGTAAVTFTVKFGDAVIANALHMRQVDGKWRIFDAGTNGRMMIAGIRKEYEQQAQRATPLDYVKAMVAQVPGGRGNPQRPPQAGPRQQPQQPQQQRSAPQ